MTKTQEQIEQEDQLRRLDAKRASDGQFNESELLSSAGAAYAEALDETERQINKEDVTA
jgi:hypothetical protein